MSSRKTFLRLAFLAGLQAVQAGIDLGSSQNVAVYWGELTVRNVSCILIDFRSKLPWPVYWTKRSAASVLLLSK